MSLEDDIETRLDNQLIAGESTNWKIEFYWESDEPDRLVVITATPGAPPDAVGPTDKPRFQIRVRGGPGESKQAEDKTIEIFKDLHRLGSQSINGTSYGGILAVQRPAWLRKDDNNRDWFAVNFQTWRARS